MAKSPGGESTLHTERRRKATALLGAAMVPVLMGLSGCSNEGSTISGAPPKAEVVKRRDEMQKATQSGIPGKSTSKPGGRRQ